MSAREGTADWFPLACELAFYVPLRTLFRIPCRAALDSIRNQDGTVTLLWAQHGATDVEIPETLYDSVLTHANQLHRRIDMEYAEQRMFLREDAPGLEGLQPEGDVWGGRPAAR